jgi:hypothetical protein
VVKTPRSRSAEPENFDDTMLYDLQSSTQKAVPGPGVIDIRPNARDLDIKNGDAIEVSRNNRPYYSIAQLLTSVITRVRFVKLGDHSQDIGGVSNLVLSA